MVIFVKRSFNTRYGPNNPEPQGLKDSSVVRDPEKDSLHAALEYIDGSRAGRQPNPGD